MVCDCCGKKRKLFESYAEVEFRQKKLNLCVDCNDLAYKVRDDAHEHDKNVYKLHLSEWEKRSKTPSKLFTEWRKYFLKKIEDKFTDEEKQEM